MSLIGPRRALLVGTPGWVLPGSSVDMNFAHSQAWSSGQIAPITSLLTTVRASTGYAQTSSGLLVQFAANAPRITDQGLLVEEARTNLAIWSQDFTNVNWSTSSFTTTANAGAAPDGTTTASRIVYVGGLGSPDTRFIQQAVAISGGTASKPFTVSFWLKSNTGSNQAVRLKNTQAAVLDSFSAITVTPAWKQYSLTVTNGASAGNGNQTIGIVAALADTAVDILVWDGQMENAAFATSPIPTTTVAVARAADVISLTGAAATAALAAQSALSITNLVQGASGAARIVQWSGAANLRFGATTTVVTAAPPNSATATIGNSGASTGVVKAAFGFDAASLTAIANGGTKIISANPWVSNTGSVFLGSNSGSAVINGYLQRLAFSASKGQFDGLTQ